MILTARVTYQKKNDLFYRIRDREPYANSFTNVRNHCKICSASYMILFANMTYSRNYHLRSYHLRVRKINTTTHSLVTSLGTSLGTSLNYFNSPPYRHVANKEITSIHHLTGITITNLAHECGWLQRQCEQGLWSGSQHSSNQLGT